MTQTAHTSEYIDLDTLIKERDEILEELVTAKEALLSSSKRSGAPMLVHDRTDKEIVRAAITGGYQEVPSISSKERMDGKVRLVSRKEISNPMKEMLQVHLDWQAQQSVQAMFQLARAQVGYVDGKPSEPDMDETWDIGSVIAVTMTDWFVDRDTTAQNVVASLEPDSAHFESRTEDQTGPSGNDQLHNPHTGAPKKAISGRYYAWLERLSLQFLDAQRFIAYANAEFGLTPTLNRTEAYQFARDSARDYSKRTRATQLLEEAAAREAIRAGGTVVKPLF